MDVKAKTDELVGKLLNDPELEALYAKDPTKAVEKALGLDQFDEQVGKIAESVKAKLTADKVSDAVDSAVDSIKGLFGK